MAHSGRGEWEQFWKRVWRKESFTRLSVPARLLYIWSWTHEDSALCGLYGVSPRQLERALAERDGGSDAGLRRAVVEALRELAVKPLVLYDDDAEVLWVVGRVEHALRSPTQAVRMLREYEACPASPLKEQFTRKYGAKLDLPANG